MRPQDKAEIAGRFKKPRHRALMTQLQLGHVLGIGTRRALSSSRPLLFW